MKGKQKRVKIPYYMFVAYIYQVYYYYSLLRYENNYHI